MASKSGSTLGPALSIALDRLEGEVRKFPNFYTECEGLGYTHTTLVIYTSVPRNKLSAGFLQLVKQLASAAKGGSPVPLVRIVGPGERPPGIGIYHSHALRPIRRPDESALSRIRVKVLG